jgi:16S rRNA (guanine1207-N2)-methyltransferase
MISDPLRALLYALDFIHFDRNLSRVVAFGNYDPGLTNQFPKLLFSTPYAGQASLWRSAQHQAFDFLEPVHAIFLQLPQQTQEADFAIATCLDLLLPSGMLMVSADNLAGGKTLSKRLAAFGCPVQDLSKHKCRVAWTALPQSADKIFIARAVEMGGVQIRKHDGLYSQPGIFSWAHRDVGTNILIKYLPLDLAGQGLDLGCGLGELGLHVLNVSDNVTSLTCVDHDRRALECCQHNLTKFGARANFLWEDIPLQFRAKNFDFVVMNPPFHKGREEHKDLGKSFIQKARNALKKNGQLYMVANSHLPYEDVIKSLFTTCSLLGQENGFKIFKAVA